MLAYGLAREGLWWVLTFLFGALAIRWLFNEFPIFARRLFVSLGIVFLVIIASYILIEVDSGPTVSHDTTPPFKLQDPSSVEQADQTQSPPEKSY